MLLSQCKMGNRRISHFLAVYLFATRCQSNSHQEASSNQHRKQTQKLIKLGWWRKCYTEMSEPRYTAMVLVRKYYILVAVKFCVISMNRPPSRPILNNLTVSGRIWELSPTIGQFVQICRLHCRSLPPHCLISSGWSIILHNTSWLLKSQKYNLQKLRNMNYTSQFSLVC